MELSELYIKKLEDEGFASVYEWQDAAGTVYKTHEHQGKVAILVTDGSITFTVGDEITVVNAGERFDIPPHFPHSAIVGAVGWIGIIGEE